MSGWGQAHSHLCLNIPICWVVQLAMLGLHPLDCAPVPVTSRLAVGGWKTSGNRRNSPSDWRTGSFKGINYLIWTAKKGMQMIRLYDLTFIRLKSPINACITGLCPYNTAKCDTSG